MKALTIKGSIMKKRGEHWMNRDNGRAEVKRKQKPGTLNQQTPYVSYEVHVLDEAEFDISLSLSEAMRLGRVRFKETLKRIGLKINPTIEYDLTRKDKHVVRALYRAADGNFNSSRDKVTDIEGNSESESSEGGMYLD